jgi:NAD(P)-dependent dehydrogenase (short-subunit alcohol dehydrogenase family)
MGVKVAMSDRKLCNSGEFEGKVVIVTGGGRGIGKAFSRALAERGAAVGILGRTEATVKKLADELNGEGRRAVGILCDVANEVQVEAAVAKVADLFGGVDILINNAGLHAEEYSDKGFGELGIAESRRLFDVNVMGIVICSLTCKPLMARRGGGVILNISSIAADLSAHAYGVSKLAANGLTMSLATEFAKDKIRVNGIAPGMIITEETHQEINEADLRAFTHGYMTENQLVQKIAGPEEIVNAMLYFCSDWSSFVTGETLKVSGGYPLHS